MMTTRQSVVAAARAPLEQTRSRRIVPVREGLPLRNATSAYGAHQFWSSAATSPGRQAPSAVAIWWAALSEWIARIHAERGIRRGTEELMMRDDRMLADIGLSRADIAYAVRHGRLPR